MVVNALIDNQVRQETRVSLLSKVMLFSHVSSTGLDELAKLAQEISFKAGENIVVEGDFVDSFYIIVSGKANVTHKEEINSESIDVILAILNVNDTIGLNDIGFYSQHGRRTATVTALTSILLLRVSIKDFRIYLKNYPLFGKQLEESTNFFTRIDFIKELSLFAQLNNDELYSLTQQVKEITLPSETIIFNKNDFGDGCYIIVEGQVEIFLPLNDGSELHRTLLKKKDLFGEASLLTSNNRNASARTKDNCDLLFIERNLFLEIIKNNTDFARSTIGFMMQNLHPVRQQNIIEHQGQTKNGNIMIMLENPVTNQYYRLTEQSGYIWQQLDGIQTIQNIIIGFIKKFHIIAPDLICNLLYTLEESGFVEIPSVTYPFEEDTSNAFSQRIKSFIQKISNYEYSFTHTDPQLTSIYQSFVFVLYKWPIQILLIFTIAYGLYLFTDQHQNIIQIAHDTTLNFWLFLLFLPIISTLAVVTHELAHAFTAKKMGYKVQRMGLGWFGLGPVAFVDTSELWLADKLTRLTVNIAGIYVELLFASILVLLSTISTNATLSIFLWLYALVTYYGAFKNANPIREYDGYAIISDLFNREKLHKTTLHFFASKYCHLDDKENKFVNHKFELYYTIICLTYLILSGLFVFFIVKSFLEIFSIKYVLYIPIFEFSAIISLLFFTLSIISLWREFKRYINMVT